MEATIQLSAKYKAKLAFRHIYFGAAYWFRRNGGLIAPINAFLQLFGKRIIIAASKKRTIEMYREMMSDESIETWNKYKRSYRMYVDFPDPVDQEYKVYQYWKNRNLAK